MNLICRHDAGSKDITASQQLAAATPSCCKGGLGSRGFSGNTRVSPFEFSSESIGHFRVITRVFPEARRGRMIALGCVRAEI